MTTNDPMQAIALMLWAARKETATHAARRVRARFAGEADRNLVGRFIVFHQANPEVFEEFVLGAFRALGAGFSHYSGWVIINKIRWHIDINTVRNGEPFEINNDFIALYARLANDLHPCLKDFFETRKMKPSGRKQSQEELARREA
jgi:hypothetical protein